MTEPTLYNHDAEKALIGSVIEQPERYENINLETNDFHDAKNKLVWKAISKLDEEGRAIDNITIADRLEVEGDLSKIGGPSYIAGLITQSNPFSLDEYSGIVRDYSLKRKLKDQAERLAKLAYSQSIAGEDIDKIIVYLHNLKPGEQCKYEVINDNGKQRWTVAELLDAELPEPNWAIPGIVPEGLNILGGRPKVGKSWLALQMAHSIGTGGIFFNHQVEKGNVLYIALEDGPRRLQDRIKLHHIPRDAQINFERNWPPLQNEGMSLLFAEILQNTYRLIVIDTLTRSLRGMDQNDQPHIDAVMSELQRLCADHHLAILFNDHTTKPKGFMGDPIDDIMNSTVKTAAADQILALYKQQGRATANLKGRGRDTEEIDYTLRWDNLTCAWQLEGETGQIIMTEERQDILDALEELGKSTAPTIAKYLGKDVRNTRKKLNDLYSMQLVKREKIENNIYFEKI